MAATWRVVLLGMCGLMLETWAQPREADAAARPNVLFLIADDASRHFGRAYGCDWAHTPRIDRLARQGLVFDQCYVPTSKCAPCRAALLTGRYPWQNGQAANHQNYFPAELGTFTEVLSAAGYVTGSVGKVWGPGEAKTAEGAPRHFALPSPQLRGARRQAGNPAEKFAAFLRDRPTDRPFFFWFGSSNPHRPYAAGSGLAAGKQL